MKPIKVSAGEFITDANFNPMMFSESGALKRAKEHAKFLSNTGVKGAHKYKIKGVKDCGDFYTWTIN